MNQAPALKAMLNAELLSASFVGEFAVGASSHSQQPLSPPMSVESLGSNIFLSQLHCYPS